MSWHNLAIPLAGILMPLALVPLTMAMRLRQRKREWEHLERMKALELGMPRPIAPAAGGVAAIGAGVPIVAFSTAFLTSLLLFGADAADRPISDEFLFGTLVEYAVPIHAVAWSCAAVVSILALTAAVILGAIQARTAAQALESSQWVGAHAKPTFNSEAYDFAGHPG